MGRVLREKPKSAVTREEVLGELRRAGFTEDIISRDYWVDYIVDYRNRGYCGSVNFSTVEFIPVFSKILAAFKAPDAAN